MLVVVLTGCQSGGQTTDVDNRPVYSPATVDAFVASIGPNRIIELDPKVTYRLDQAQRGVSDFYVWINTHNEHNELVIRGCPGLTIRSAGPELAHVATRFAYAYVLGFERCDNLELQSLKLGHAPDPGYCLGGVVKIKESQDLLIKESLLYGCGTDGLLMKKVRGLRFEKSIIEDCTYGILTASESRGLHFVDSVFRRNVEFYGFVFDNSVDIRFEQCFVLNNTLNTGFDSTPIFRTNLNVPEAEIIYIGGAITGNKAGALASPDGMFRATKAVLKGNTFTPATER